MKWIKKFLGTGLDNPNYEENKILLFSGIGGYTFGLIMTLIRFREENIEYILEIVSLQYLFTLTIVIICIKLYHCRESIKDIFVTYWKVCKTIYFTLRVLPQLIRNIWYKENLK